MHPGIVDAADSSPGTPIAPDPGGVRLRLMGCRLERRPGAISRVRVELEVQRTSDLQIPLEHGMPGSVEVEVERAAPLALVVRSLGQAVTGVTAAAAPTDQDRNRSEDERQ